MLPACRIHGVRGRLSGAPERVVRSLVVRCTQPEASTVTSVLSQPPAARSWKFADTDETARG